MLFNCIFRNVNVTLLCITNTPTMLYAVSPEKWSFHSGGRVGDLAPLSEFFGSTPVDPVWNGSSSHKWPSPVSEHLCLTFYSVHLQEVRLYFYRMREFLAPALSKLITLFYYLNWTEVSILPHYRFTKLYARCRTTKQEKESKETALYHQIW